MKIATMFVSAILSLLTTGVVYAGDMGDGTQRYSVTITNVTRGQVITPPVVITHRGDFSLFTPGSPAIPELAALAEDGPTAPLLGFLAIQPQVFDSVAATDVVLPGHSVTLEVTATAKFSHVTAVGMLASTNDTFFAAHAVLAPRKGQMTIGADAYDAGSEANNESCDFIPGPPCGSANVRATDGAEGYVHVSGGVHGIGSLVPSMHDWRNPVAEVAIQRLP